MFYRYINILYFKTLTAENMKTARKYLYHLHFLLLVTLFFQKENNFFKESVCI